MAWRSVQDCILSLEIVYNREKWGHNWRHAPMSKTNSEKPKKLKEKGMPLTVKVCDAAKPMAKPYKLGDSGGMYLEIMPNGSKYWRLKYRWLGKEKRLALGIYAELHEKFTRMIARDFLGNLIKAVSYKIHTILTDNGIQFAKREGTEDYRNIPFDRVCLAHTIDHRLTKIKHP